METPLKYGYYPPNLTDKCFGCGKCEKACLPGQCPEAGGPADGQTRIVVTPRGSAGSAGCAWPPAPTMASTA